MILFWGPRQEVIYNDSYIPVCLLTIFLFYYKKRTPQKENEIKKKIEK